MLLHPITAVKAGLDKGSRKNLDALAIGKSCFIWFLGQSEKKSIAPLCDWQFRIQQYQCDLVNFVVVREIGNVGKIDVKYSGVIEKFRDRSMGKAIWSDIFLFKRLIARKLSFFLACFMWRTLHSSWIGKTNFFEIRILIIMILSLTWSDLNFFFFFCF